MFILIISQYVHYNDSYTINNVICKCFLPKKVFYKISPEIKPIRNNRVEIYKSKTLKSLMTSLLMY